MNKSIRVSSKHGVNPTIPICFWCGKEKSEIILLGKLPGDKEAPRNLVVDYEPCDSCKQSMAQGITIIEAVLGTMEDRPEIQKGVTPTGRFMVFSEDYIKRNIKDEAQLKVVLDKRKIFMSVEDFTPYAEQAKELTEGNKDGE